MRTDSYRVKKRKLFSLPPSLRHARIKRMSPIELFSHIARSRCRQSHVKRQKMATLQQEQPHPDREERVNRVYLQRERRRREALKTLFVGICFIVICFPFLLFVLHTLVTTTKETTPGNVTLCVHFELDNISNASVNSHCIDYVNATFKVYGRIILLSLSA